MILLAFSIFDRAAMEYAPPFFARSDAEAERSIRISLIQDKGGVMGSFPEDFDLLRIGSFDSSSGRFVPDDEAFLIGHCVNLLIQEDVEE